MSADIEVLFLLVARGGSKGLPGKNLRTINGLSLIGFKALAARQSKYCSRLMVSTDSAEIQDEARRWGVEVPFTRPAELASDTAGSAEVILHAMDWIEQTEGRTYDAIMLLEPSSPFATPAHFDAAVELFTERQADLVVGMRETEVSSIFVGTMGQDGNIGQIVNQMHAATGLRRQDQPMEVTMNGALYLIRWGSIRTSRRIYDDPARSFGLLMDRPYSVEIETAHDFAVAELTVKRGMIDLPPWAEGLQAVPVGGSSCA